MSDKMRKDQARRDLVTTFQRAGKRKASTEYETEQEAFWRNYELLSAWLGKLRSRKRNSGKMTTPSTPTKAELHEMLAEAVRNTQPQPVNTQPQPVRDVRPGPKRKKRPRNRRPAPKRTAKKSVRASARKRQPR